MKCWCCDYVGDNIGCWAIMVVMVVIEMGVDNKEVYKVGKVVTKEQSKAKSAETGFFFVLVVEIIQVLDSIAWVRCASGNVL